MAIWPGFLKAWQGFLKALFFAEVSETRIRLLGYEQLTCAEGSCVASILLELPE